MTRGGDHLREAIVAAARTLFAANGYQATKITDIAALAEVSHTSIYAKFESKRKLFEHALGAVAVEPGTDRATARGRRTREALLTAARTVFERDGYGAARLGDICEVAGVSPATFYTYFDSKEQVFRETVLGVLGALHAELDAPGAAADPRAVVAEAIRRYRAAAERGGRMLAVLDEAAALAPAVVELRAAVEAGLVRRAALLIDRWQRAGRAAPEPAPEASAAALLTMVQRSAASDEALTLLCVRALGLSEPAPAPPSSSTVAPRRTPARDARSIPAAGRPEGAG
jgi:AcrR family transcriptional regulator